MSKPRAVPTCSVVFRQKDCSHRHSIGGSTKSACGLLLGPNQILVPACMHPRLAGLACSTHSAAARSGGVIRWLSTIHYDSTASDVEALLHESLVR